MKRKRKITYLVPEKRRKEPTYLINYLPKITTYIPTYLLPGKNYLCSYVLNNLDKLNNSTYLSIKLAALANGKEDERKTHEENTIKNGTQNYLHTITHYQIITRIIYKKFTISINLNSNY